MIAIMGGSYPPTCTLAFFFLLPSSPRCTHVAAPMAAPASPGRPMISPTMSA